MKISVNLTQDQQRLLVQLLDDYIIYNPTSQTAGRVSIAHRTKRALLNKPQEIDHSYAAAVINEKLAEDELKLPAKLS